MGAPNGAPIPRSLVSLLAIRTTTMTEAPPPPASALGGTGGSDLAGP